MSDQQACQTPLIDLLRSAPADGRAEYEHSPTAHQFIPYGRLMHEAADEIDRLRAENSAMRNVLARVHRDGGHYMEEHGVLKSAADAEAVIVSLIARVAELEAKVKELSTISVSMPEFTAPPPVDTIFLGTFYYGRRLGSVKIKRHGSLFTTAALPFHVSAGTRLEISFVDGPVIANVILPKAAWEKDVYTIDLSLST